MLEGLLEYEKAAGGTPASRKARASGEEYLLTRRLFRRLRTGAAADARFLDFLHPHRWRYDIPRALDYFRGASMPTGFSPDRRLQEAIDHLRSKRQANGTWLLAWRLGGRVWFDIDDEPGHPSRWLTLRALRILRWWDSNTDAPQ